MLEIRTKTNKNHGQQPFDVPVGPRLQGRRVPAPVFGLLVPVPGQLE